MRTYSFTDSQHAGIITVSPTTTPCANPHVHLATDAHDVQIPLDQVAAFVAGIWDAAQQAAHAAGVLPCPHPRCGPCSFDRALPKEN